MVRKHIATSQSLLCHDTLGFHSFLKAAVMTGETRERVSRVGARRSEFGTVTSSEAQQNSAERFNIELEATVEYNKTFKSN